MNNESLYDKKINNKKKINNNNNNNNNNKIKIKERITVKWSIYIKNFINFYFIFFFF